MEVIPPMIPPMLKQAELTSPKGVLFRPLNPPTGNPVLAEVSFTPWNLASHLAIRSRLNLQTIDEQRCSTMKLHPNSLKSKHNDEES